MIINYDVFFSIGSSRFSDFFVFFMSHVFIHMQKVMALKTFELLKGCETHEEIMKVLAAVAVDLGDVIDDLSTVEVNPLKGAMTNQVFEVNWPTKSDGHVRRVLIRLYGEGVDIFFDRYDEIQTFECMSKNGQGPRLLGRFTTGRVEEFIHARVCVQHHLVFSLISQR